MGRSEEFQGAQSPVKKYLSWSSETNSFSFWDKAEEIKKSLELPYSFILLKEMHKFVGWSDAHGAAIFSNEVAGLKESMKVRIHGEQGDLAEGPYDVIKDKVKAAGGKYAKVLYVFDGKEIQAITIKGAALTAFINFSNDNRDALKYNFITVASFEAKKKGKTDYSEPVFTAGARIEEDVSKEADAAYDTVKGYLSGKITPAFSDAGATPDADIDLPDMEDEHESPFK